MKKTYILPAIIILMSVSLLGIILVQFYWIRNAVEVREKNFDQAVSRALSDVSHRLSRDNNVMFVSDQMENEGYSVHDGYIYGDSVKWVGENDEDENNSFVMVNSNSRINTITMSTDHSEQSGAIVSVEAFQDSGFRYKTVLKLDSIKDDLDEQEYIILTEFRDSIDVIVDEKLSMIKRKKSSLNRVIEDMVIELENYEKPLIESFTSEQVTNRILESLADNGIDLDFEYAITSVRADSVYQLSSEGFEKDFNKRYQVSLFPDLVFSNPEQLQISFPERRAHILKSLGFLLSGSLFFTIIILLTFFITIRFILQQKKLSNIKSDFINNMTHEFKTPIATISLAVDSINNTSVIHDSEKVRYFSGIIGEENKRMNSRVESILQMSLIDSNDFSLSFEEIDIHNEISKAIKNIDLMTRQKGGEIEVNFEADDPIIICDKLHFSNIITNLLDNAIKYSPEKPDVILNTIENDNNITISIKDHGIGMKKEEQEKIFDKFYRVSKGDIHNVKGFGLGLSYVKAIIFSLGGEISVKSQYGKGTEFIIVLPRKQNA